MSINIGPPVVDELKPKIAVIGCGGAGGNAVANMIKAQVEGVDFIITNTDAQALNSSPAELRIQLGPEITQGLGAGSRPEVGRAAAEETIEQVKSSIEGCHMVFIAAGMGGGTGTGAAPVIAEAAREMNILTVGVVTKPFLFEGSRRMRSADAGIEELQKHVDTLIVIPNQNLFLVANPNTTFKEAFLLADEVLQQGVRGITDLMVMPGLINLDFADVRSVMHEMGKAMMGTGEAEGDGRALEAAEKAIANPLLDGVSMKGAKGVIVSITGGEDMRLMEVDEAANHIRELVDPDANIIWGSAFNENLDGRIRVSVVATGIDTDAPSAPTRTHSFERQETKSQNKSSYLFGGNASDNKASSNATSNAEAAPKIEPVAKPAEEKVNTPEPERPTKPAFSVPNFSSMKDEPAAQAEPVSKPVNEDAPLELSQKSDDIMDLNDSVAEEVNAATDEAPKIASGGGTLFERMSNLSRGIGRDKEETGDNVEAVDENTDNLNIPRFLDRQSNN